MAVKLNFAGIGAPRARQAFNGVVGSQGSKAKLAPVIVDAMEARFGPARTWPAFHDLCCGTASVAIEVLRRAPSLPVTAVDAGGFGFFWATFQADRQAVIRHIVRLVPPDVHRGAACRAVLGLPVAVDDAQRAAQFIVAVNGHMFGVEPRQDDVWAGNCIPASVGVRGPSKLVAKLMAVPRFTAVHGFAEEVQLSAGGVAFVDPPYAGARGYRGVHCDVARVVQGAKAAGARIAVSHDGPLPGVPGQVVQLDTRCLRNVCRPEALVFPA